MLTTSWTSYAGPGRIALSPVPPGTLRGYKLAPRPLRLLRPRTPAEVRAVLLSLDPIAVAVELHRTVYPWRPVLMSDDVEATATYRRVVADWLERGAGLRITEVEATTYRPQRAELSEWVRLRRLLNSRSAA